MKEQIKHPNSRKITIFRAGTFISRAQGSAADAYFAQSKVGIGSYWESVNTQKVGTGLTFKEQELLLPDIIDTPIGDKDFRKKVTEFYSELNTNVPFQGGVTLEIGLEVDNTKALSKDNYPLNPMDYLRYRHAIKHPKVAGSKEEADGNQLVDFYIFDKEALQNKNSVKIKERDAAFAEYLKIKEEEDQVDQMLTLLGVDIRDYETMKDKEDHKVEKLRELAEKKPKEFMEAIEAGDLEERAWIQQMVNTGVLKKYGERYVDPEGDGKPLANSIDELILFFKDEENSGPVTVLKARQQEAAKKPVVHSSRKTRVS